PVRYGSGWTTSSFAVASSTGLVALDYWSMPNTAGSVVAATWTVTFSHPGPRHVWASIPPSPTGVLATGLARYDVQYSTGVTQTVAPPLDQSSSKWRLLYDPL